MSKRGLCERCGDPFERTQPHKRFCSERCQRIAEQRRFRARHTEEVRCRACRRTFKRSAKAERKKVYCSLACQYEYRSAQYQARADIQAILARARGQRARGASRTRSKPDRRGGPLGGCTDSKLSAEAVPGP